MPPEDSSHFDDSPEGWAVYRKLILAELDRLAMNLNRVESKLDNFRTEELQRLWREFNNDLHKVREMMNEQNRIMMEDITALKVKAGVAGFLAGLLGALFVGLILYSLTGKR